MRRVSIAGGMMILVAAAVPVATTASSVGSSQRPTLKPIGASIALTEPRDGYGGKAVIRVRFCAEIGPRAVLLIRETLTIGGRRKASIESVEPLGVDLEQVMPYSCVRNFHVGWLVRARFLRGGGTYSVTVRLRDGNGRVTRPIGFSLRSG